jgi:3-oxoacyl-[acyl-carrier protein] reductase
MAKQVLITGGSKGIGRAVAECLAAAGYNVVITYSSDNEAAATAVAEIKNTYSVAAASLRADITQKASIDTIADYVAQNNLVLDALVLNAGATLRSKFEEMTIEEWENVFFANVHFPVFLIRKLLNSFSPQAGIVFTGSLMGIYPHSMSLAYGVSKNAELALVKNLVKFLQPYHIRVNGVTPGFVDTEWQKAKPAEIRRSIESKISLQRFSTPEENAEVYKMLIENRYFNGEIIVIDGGYSYQ